MGWHYLLRYESTVHLLRTYHSQAEAEAAGAVVKECLSLIGLYAKALITGLAATGLVGLVAAAPDPRIRRRAPFALGLLVFSLVATGAGYYWRNHYFIMMIPAVAILVGVGVTAVVRLVVRTGLPAALRWIPVGLFLAALVYAVAGEHARSVLLELTPDMANRAIYFPNPYLESVPIAEYLEKHTASTDTIAVVGSEPQIFFLSHDTRLQGISTRMV